jgi:peptidoglycan/LPS O-acetylase OafA/YrhL
MEPSPQVQTVATRAPALEASAGAHARYLATRTFGSLDGLRAISILVVVWHHTHHGDDRWPITVRGFLGVDLFFLVSGFLIVTLLLRERRRTGTTSLRSFYIRRFLRIFPPYYAMLAIVAGITMLKSADPSAVRADLPWAVCYLSNMVPMTSVLAITWSLAVEEQFYLAVPALQKYAPRWFPALAAGAYLLASLFPLGFAPGLHLPAFFRETTFGPILLGVLLAYVLDDPRSYAIAWRALRHPASPAFALAAVLAASSYPGPDLTGWPRIAIHWALLLLLASCVVRERHVFSRALSLWPVQRVGIVSYGIYLFHMLVMHLVEKGMRAGGLQSRWVFFVGSAVGTWLVAEVSYRWFESRCLALKARWT